MENKFMLQNAAILMGALLAALVISLVFERYFDWMPDFVIATLVITSLFMSFVELAFGGVLAMALLGWQPGIRPELLLVWALPLALFFLRNVISVRSGFGIFFVVISSILTFYGILSGGFFQSELPMLAADLTVSGAYGVLLFHILKPVNRYNIAP